MISLNGFFILKPYQQGQGIRTEIRGGLALPGQKNNLVGLELLADTRFDGDTFKAGSTAYIQEELLMSHPWAKKVMKAEDIEGEFIVVEGRHITAVRKFFKYE
jgi:hypothetical protein